MNKISNFLWKVFCTFMVFSYHNSADSAIKPEKVINGEYEICPKNYYVYKCGNYVVGTNWLKGFGYTENNTNKHTGDYYDHGSEANVTNRTNLRKMFYGEAITYTDSNLEFQTRNANNYKNDRDIIFNTYCNPQNVNIECKPCPGSGTTSKSTIKMESSMQIASDPAWKLRNIFNCTIKSFSDTTGNYKYYFLNANGDITYTTAPCYYEVTRVGDKLADRYYTINTPGSSSTNRNY